MENQLKHNWTIRTYESSDCNYLAELFYQTIHSVNAKDYTKEQLDVWADGIVNLAEWDRLFSEHDTVVAMENAENGKIVGFGDIDKTGYLDKLYVHKDYQNQGIASALCNILEQAAFSDKITVHASITAKSFFLSRGYQIIKKQQVLRHGISLTNYVMEKVVQ